MRMHWVVRWEQRDEWFGKLCTCSPCDCLMHCVWMEAGKENLRYGRLGDWTDWNLVREFRPWLSFRSCGVILVVAWI